VTDSDVHNLDARSLVPISIARIISVRSKAALAGYCGGICAVLTLFGSNTLQNAVANGDTRTISFHHIHLKEDTTITYKVNGRYDEAALGKISWALRDWRTNQPTKMDPHLIDALWEVYREVGATEPIHVIGGYRSPATNAMLRRRSSGVAKFSQHMRGKALDFFIPGVALQEIRHAGLRLQRGGVGFYPSSGAPFVHMDTGNVRHWPRMPEAQLARVMAKGPLTRVASAAATTKRASAFGKMLAGRGDGDQSTTVSTRSRVAAATRADATGAAVPMPPAKPTVTPTNPSGGFQLASATSRPAQIRPARATSLVAQSGGTVISANEIINERGYWQGLVEPAEIAQANAATRSRAPARQPAGRTDPLATGSVASASVAPWPIPSRAAAGAALAYAPTTDTAVVRPAPMGKTAARVARQPRETTVAVKRRIDRPSADTSHPPVFANPAKLADKLNDPWMRAMIVSPNAKDFMSTSLLGAPDFRELAQHLQSPDAAVMMTFSDDPHLGMSADRFQGHAVVFVATVTFNRQTAALR
jgi:uncharacterized protein YcbK (DUF882 family)